MVVPRSQGNHPSIALDDCDNLLCVLPKLFYPSASKYACIFSLSHFLGNCYYVIHTLLHLIFFLTPQYILGLFPSQFTKNFFIFSVVAYYSIVWIYQTLCDQGLIEGYLFSIFYHKHMYISHFIILHISYFDNHKI